MLIQCYILGFQSFEIAALARGIEMVQEGSHQRFAIVLPLLVEARSKGHQIAVVGGSISFYYFFYLDIETRQTDNSSEAELEKHFHSACLYIIEQTGFFALGRDIGEYGIGFLAIGNADGIIGEEGKRNLPE